MENDKITLWILHAGIEHPSPYFYNFCKSLKKYDSYEYFINPELPLEKRVNKGIVYFNRLKRFYKSDSLESAKSFLKNIDTLKSNGWKIVWTLHNFYPIDRTITEVDEYVTNEFIKKCDIVFTVSKYMRNSIKKHFNINAINHGVGIIQMDNHSVNDEVKRLRRSYKFTFTFIGNIYKYKMVDKIIDAFKKLDNCRLIIAGTESKNAFVNTKELVKDNDNIIFINKYIDCNDWNKLSSVTDCFVSLYDLNLPAFKYGFFPSNYTSIAKTGIKCISPKSKIIEEMMYSDQMIYYDFNSSDGLFNAMNKATILKNTKVSPRYKYNYEWESVLKTFTEHCNKLFK